MSTTKGKLKPVTKSEEVTEGQVEAQEQVQDVQHEKQYVISEKAFNTIVSFITEQPWRIANPLVELIQKNTKQL